jgi:hypothetical protein
MAAKMTVNGSVTLDESLGLQNSRVPGMGRNIAKRVHLAGSFRDNNNGPELFGHISCSRYGQNGSEHREESSSSQFFSRQQ